MNRRLIIAAVLGALCGASTTQAAIIITGDTETATTFSLGLTWNPESPNPATAAAVNPFWKWDVKFQTTPTLLTLTFHGQHLVPAGGTFTSILTIPVTGLGFAGFGQNVVEPLASDKWTSSIFRDSASLPLTVAISAVHTPVPEPSEFALVGGLGLLGFGAYRRFRKA